MSTHTKNLANNREITPELVAEHGLKPDEYGRILASLGRAPTFVELGVFSVMWSEHCSYKSSRVHLGRLPTTGPRVLIGPGENAGAVDAVATGAGAHVKDRVADAGRGAEEDLILLRDAAAEGVDQAVSVIAGVEAGLAA